MILWISFSVGIADYIYCFTDNKYCILEINPISSWCTAIFMFLSLICLDFVEDFYVSFKGYCLYYLLQSLSLIWIAG